MTVADRIGTGMGARTEREIIDPLLERMREHSVLLLGEASHGTHESYAVRAEITKRLIAEQGLTAIAVEADWPDAQRVNAYVHGEGDDPTTERALGDFRRFPTWMWRNAVVADFVGWLREWNDGLPEGAPKVGFYGLDLYSLRGSIDAVLRYLDDVDPEAAARARARYACFDHAGGDAQEYGYATAVGAVEPCEDAVVEQLLDVQRTAADAAARDGRVEDARRFAAEQNARLVRNAERYYRAMFRGHVSSWNLRDRHMAEILDALLEHLGRDGGRRPKVAVWAHNSHLGDARATEMSARGELNLGQLATERHGDEAFRLGFSTHSGTVTAASDWDAPAERKRVRPGLPGSWEHYFHESLGRDALVFTDASREYRRRRLQRAIGVIYRPETERMSHYFQAVPAEQFHAVIHLDRTRAVEPLETTPGWVTGEAPETFPHGE